MTMIHFSQLLALHATMSSLLLQPSSGFGDLAQQQPSYLGRDPIRSTLYKQKPTSKKPEIPELSDIKLKELEEGKEYSFEIKFKEKLQCPVSVKIEVVNPETKVKIFEKNKTNSSSSLNLYFQKGENAKSISIKIPDDKIDKENKSLILKITSEGKDYNSSRENVYNLIVIDNDSKGLTLEYNTNKLEFLGTLKGKESLSFKIRLKDKLEDGQQANVNVISDKDNMLRIEKSKLTFNSSNWENDQEIKIELNENNKNTDFTLFFSGNIIGNSTNNSKENSNNELPLLVTLGDTEKLLWAEPKSFNYSCTEKDGEISCDSTLQFFNVSLKFDYDILSLLPKPKIDLYEDSLMYFKVKLNSEPENSVNLEINASNDMINVINKNLEFNSENWNEFKFFAIQYQENNKDNSDQPVSIGFTTFGENYNKNFNLMSIVAKDNDDDGTPILIGILAISTAVLGLGGISFIFKNLGNEWAELRNAIEITSQTHRFFKERATQENLEGKLDEINARLDSIETKIDEKNS